MDRNQPDTTSLSLCIWFTRSRILGLICSSVTEGRHPSEDWIFLWFQWRPSWMLRRKSWVDSTWQAVETGHGAMLHTSASPASSCFRPFPSNDTHAEPLLLNGTCTLTVTWSGNISGRKDRECGQIGVNKIPGTCKKKTSRLEYCPSFMIWKMPSWRWRSCYLWMDHWSSSCKWVSGATRCCR